MKLFIVIRQSISGWQRKNIIAFQSEFKAKLYIENQENNVQFDYRIELIDVILD